MCRRANSLSGPRTLFAVLAFGCLFLGAGSLVAQAEEGFPLDPQTRQDLVEVQELWIDWLTEVQLGELEAGASKVGTLLEKSNALGMRGLPELATAATVQAMGFAEDGEFEKAEAALDAAERLQPGEPEQALAAMMFAWNQGRWLAASGSLVRGAIRIFRSPLSRRVALANLFHWLLVVLTLAAFSFVGIEMATRGSLLVADLAGFIKRSLPPAAALFLTAILMVWPIVLPAGVLWLALYWSVLLWGYGTRGVQVVMIGLWLLLGGLPILVSEHVQRLDLDLSAPVRAMGDVASGRMTGSMFSDLGVLADLLPESVAVKHLEADLHLQLRQWEKARSLYREVLAKEPDQAAVLADLGTVYFYEGDLDNAIQSLQRAAAPADAPAQVFFNLSRALSEQYRFTESEVMFRRASTLDSQAVGDWISSMESNRVVAVAGGFKRQAEIRREIEEVWRRDDAGASLADVWRRTLSIPLALVLAGPALGVFFLARRSRRRLPREPENWFAGPLDRIRRAAFPGLPEAERRLLGRTWLALFVALALFSLPLSGGFTFALSLGYSPPFSPHWIIAGLGLAGLFLARFVAAGSHRTKGV